MAVALSDKKQITPPTLINRLFATNIDLLIIIFIFVTLNKITHGFGTQIIINNFLMEHDISLKNYESIAAFKADYPEIYPEFMKLYTKQMFVLIIFQLILVSSYFYIFWSKIQATPGKLLLQQKIVDYETRETPTKRQYIKRLLAGVLYPVGIFGVGFSQTGRALHDKFSSTLVIKN